jgi:hypothetical protein
MGPLCERAPLPCIPIRGLLSLVGLTRFGSPTFLAGRAASTTYRTSIALGHFGRTIYFGTRSSENECRNFISWFLEEAARN